MKLVLVASLVGMSQVVHGGEVALKARESPRSPIEVRSVVESARCLRSLSEVHDDVRPRMTQGLISERVDLVARDVRRNALYDEVSVRSKPGGGALDAWSLIGGMVLVIAFASMRRRQLFRDG